MGCVQVKPKKGNIQNKSKEEVVDYEKTATPYDPQKKEVQYNVIANGVYFDALNSYD